MIWTILGSLFSSWAAEVGALTWLGLALVAAVLEVSVPHFGCAFISAGAVFAAIAAYLGLSVPVQFATFVVVLTVSIVALRAKLLDRVAGPGLPSRTDPLIGRHGQVTHDIDPILGTGRVVVGGEDWAARSSEAIAAGTRVRVVGADGIVLEVTRA
ncbi:MAG TPA: NfeD family protein [Vicinamibacterales bacterium]|nr:NfeD family protein [Vicinamibacterales bacterium]